MFHEEKFKVLEKKMPAADLLNQIKYLYSSMSANVGYQDQRI